MRYNTTIQPPPLGRECNHPTCGTTCRRIKIEKPKTFIQRKMIKSPNAEQSRWFEDRRKEMAGYCLHCHAKTAKKDDKWYRASIAHILPKRLFKSIATHPLNWIELCMWGNNCHGNFDNGMIDIIDLNCFDTVIERVVEMYPDIDPKERRYIPDVLLQYIKDNS